MNRYYTLPIFLVLLLTLLVSRNVQAQKETSQLATADSVTVYPKSAVKTIGYGTQPAQRVTSAISTVYGSDLEKTFSLNLGNTLYGRLAGVSVAQGGLEPGASTPSLFVRGVNTFGAAGADPKSVPGVLSETIKAGDIKYQDIGGPDGKPDGIIDANDRMPIGNAGLPNLSLGLHTGFRYKGFDADLVFQAVTGNTVYLGGNYFQAFQSNGQVAAIALNRWTPQTAATVDYPRLSSKDNLNNYQFSTFWQRDGSFVKLRSAEIGYSLPAGLTDKIRLRTVRFFVNGTNLLSFDRIPYGDPESLTGYPVTRTVTLGVNVQL